MESCWVRTFCKLLLFQFINFLDACSSNLRLENLVNFNYVGGQPAVAFDSSTQIRNPNDLQCINFDSNCQWSNLNVSGVDLAWHQSTVQLDPTYFSLATNTQTAPQNAYAITGTPNVSQSGTAVLMSHVIQCQQGDGNLQFQFVGVHSICVKYV
uniref:Uncharacterized protein n=1 Tax=Acrobeloides nanus TaxID=290746 RepID=A0A914E2E1_9BILA